MRFAGVVGVGLAGAWGVAILALADASCARTSDNGPALDAGPDGALFGDAKAPSPDAEPPAGETCGDRGGLQADTPWPQRGGCPKRAGVASGAGPANAIVKWSIDQPAGVSSPAIDASRLVWFGTTAGDVFALTPSALVASVFHTGAAVRSSPAIAATGVAVIGGTDGVLYGVVRGGTSGTAGDAGTDAGADADAGDAATEAGPPLGHAAFQRTLSPMSSSPAIGGDGTIYIGANDGKLYALSPDASTINWSVTTNDTGGSSPALALDGTIYVGSSDKHLYAISPDGAVKWAYETGGPVGGSPAVGGDESVYVGAADGKLYALSPAGALRWTYATGGPITGTPAVLAGVAYVGSDDKSLHAVSVVSGTGKWTFATLGAVATPVIGKDGKIYVGSNDGHLYALTPGGSLYWAVNAKGAIHSAPALSDDGTLYVSTDTSIVAIGP